MVGPHMALPDLDMALLDLNGDGESVDPIVVGLRLLPLLAFAEVVVVGQRALLAFDGGCFSLLLGCFLLLPLLCKNKGNGDGGIIGLEALLAFDDDMVCFEKGGELAVGGDCFSLLLG